MSHLPVLVVSLKEGSSFKCGCPLAPFASNYVFDCLFFIIACLFSINPHALICAVFDPVPVSSNLVKILSVKLYDNAFGFRDKDITV